MKRVLLAWLICAFAIGGLVLDATSGSGAPIAPVTAPNVCLPAPGQGHIGVCVTQPANRLDRVTSPARIVAPHGLLFDLYEGNFRNCSAPLRDARGILVGVIVKAYEFRPDSCFAHYWHLLAAAHIWHAAYVFAHGCWQAGPFVATVKAAGGWDRYAGPNIVDAEVPDAFGSVACLSPKIRVLSGVATVVGYTAPGTWPGGGDGGDPLWVATYGFNFGCVWTCHPVAWQYTDGIFGPLPHSVGPFHGDLSVNYGLAQILAHPVAPPPPAPVCYSHRIAAAQCAVVQAQVARWARARAATRRALSDVRAGLGAHHCIQPYRRSVCRRLGKIRSVLRQRARWYEAQIQTTIAKY